MDDRLRELLVRGREHYERHEYDRAEELFRELLSAAHAHRFADVHNMLGVILHERGNFNGAAEQFEIAVLINPRYTDAIMSLAVTYNDQGRYEDAKQLYVRLRALQGKDGGLDPFVRGKIANLHAGVAQAYADAGCRAEAIIELRKAVELCPAFADLQTKLGTLYRDGGELKLALEHYSFACAANPAYVPARVLLGVTLLAMGSANEAVAEWNQALAIDPHNKHAQMYLRMVEQQRAAAARGEVDDFPDEPTIAIERNTLIPWKL